MFDIALTEEAAATDYPAAVGELRFGEYRESFHAALGFWLREDYRHSWIDALTQLTHGAARSCLVTSLTDPANSNFITIWPLYREGDEVYAQNQILFLDEPGPAFDLHAPWLSVGLREVVNEDGQQISEWHLSMADIRGFLDRQAAG